MKDDRTIYMGCSCSYHGTGSKIQGEDDRTIYMGGCALGGVQGEDDRTIYMNCKCSYLGSAVGIQGEDDRTIYMGNDQDEPPVAYSKISAEKVA
jgi:hypothetical protein